jgi:hypothetical protein
MGRTLLEGVGRVPRQRSLWDIETLGRRNGHQVQYYSGYVCMYLDTRNMVSPEFKQAFARGCPEEADCHPDNHIDVNKPLLPASKPLFDRTRAAQTHRMHHSLPEHVNPHSFARLTANCTKHLSPQIVHEDTFLSWEKQSTTPINT